MKTSYNNNKDTATEPPTEIKLFHYNSHCLRVSMIDGSPWFCLLDIGRILQVVNIHQSTLFHPRHTLALLPMDTATGKQRVTVINQQGLDLLISRSKRPLNRLRAFSKWLSKEVLPSIYKPTKVSQRDLMLAMAQELINSCKQMDEGGATSC